MKDRPLRIMSYNVRYFGHALRGLASSVGPKRRIARALLALDPLPDIVCLQEVETISLRSRLAFRRDHDTQTQLEAFMVRLEETSLEAGWHHPYEAFYFGAHTYRFGSQPLYTTGLAVLVNTRTLRVESHNSESPTKITHHHVTRYRDRKQTRICAHMRLMDTSNRPLHIFNTHFSLPTPFAAAFWKEKQKMGFGVNQVAEARTLGSFVQERASGEPFIVCGDFNSAPASPVFQCLTHELCFECAQLACGQIDAVQPKAFPTAGFMHLRMHLDHLFGGGGVSWKDVAGTRPFGDTASPFFGLSDHMPLLASFRIPEGRVGNVIPDATAREEVGSGSSLDPSEEGLPSV
jgi:endonuclease/exonuclease/phosphatase family metal-dependent hydrolase